MLDAKARRAKEWTPEMRELFLMNCIINISSREGKFLAINEFNVWLIRGIKFIWNPSANFRSEHHTWEVISPNIISLWQFIAAVMRTTTASTGGTWRTCADDHGDIGKLLHLFLEDELYKYQPGRVGVAAAPIQVKPRIDAFMRGFEAVQRGKMIEQFIEQRAKLQDHWEEGMGGLPGYEDTTPEEEDVGEEGKGEEGRG
jgi:hypothetical protein